MSKFSATDKLACVERELKFRRVVYARNVRNGVMRQEQADWEIKCMESIAADYWAQRSQDDEAVA
jgi:hypothetical protein